MSLINNVPVISFFFLSLFFRNYKKNIIHEPSPKQALGFTCLLNKSFENTVWKGEIARNEQFLLFPQCFQPFWKN